MTQCEAITNKGIRCSKDAVPNSKLCIIHKNYEIKKQHWYGNIERNDVSLLLVNTLLAILISVVVFHYGVGESIKLSEKSLTESIKLSEQALNRTYWMTAPVTLIVVHDYNESTGRLKIYAKNTHPLRETGRIYLYKLEANPSKPEQVNETGLKPGETQLLFDLSFEVQYVCINKETPFGKRIDVQAGKMYYIISNETSISYKITCDNCPSQGYIARIPDFQEISVRPEIDPKNRTTKISMPVFRWTVFSLDEIRCK